MTAQWIEIDVYTFSLDKKVHNLRELKLPPNQSWDWPEWSWDIVQYMKGLKRKFTF